MRFGARAVEGEVVVRARRSGLAKVPDRHRRGAQRGYCSSAVVPLGAMMTSSAWRASADA
jgi:hypothetical protein